MKAKKILVHQRYIWHERDQNDIALIETERQFDFTSKDKISPICLPSEKKYVELSFFLNSYSLDIDTVDVGVDVLAVGWGYLYEHERKKVLR